MNIIAIVLDVPIELAGELEQAREAEQVLSVIKIHGERSLTSPRSRGSLFMKMRLDILLF